MESLLVLFFRKELLAFPCLLDHACLTGDGGALAPLAALVPQSLHCG
jgi:hypothetical protein